MNKKMSLQFVGVESPLPSNEWLSRSVEDKISGIRNFLDSNERFRDCIELSGITNQIEILVELIIPVKAAERGTLLLDFEQELKKTFDQSLVVWLQPLGDKNSLRRLRGIKIGKV
jgi:hypothetical protein